MVCHVLRNVRKGEKDDKNKINYIIRCNMVIKTLLKHMNQKNVKK